LTNDIKHIVKDVAEIKGYIKAQNKKEK
jgi:hypothetical protein